MEMNELKKKIYKIFIRIINHISPLIGSKIIYKMKFKKKLNLKNPQKFNEKLMWLKLKKYNKNPIVWKCSDKYQMREYALNHGVEEKNLVKLIGVYDDVKDINWDELPQKFAIKCTHGCGFNIICNDKAKFDIPSAEKQLAKWLKTKFGYETAEIHYTKVKPKIICEEFIENDKGVLPTDYKFYCFNGEPKIVLVCTERNISTKADFFDLDWNVLELRDDNTSTLNAKEVLKKPAHFDKMLEISRNVSKDFEFVRIDFYEYDNNAILGEMTFTPASCMAYYSKEGDKLLSDLLVIDEANKK